MSYPILFGNTASAGGTTFQPFTITLNATDRSRFGDSDATINSFWSSVTQDIITNKGKQSYDGYYACTITSPVNLEITAGGAAGWTNQNGRKVRGVFNLSANTRLVFFAGKATNKMVGGQEQGAAGGASMVATWNGSSFTPLVVAAGGSGGFNNRYDVNCAKPLSLGLSNVAASRNNLRSGTGTDGSGGVGRGSNATAQQGGAGWNTRAFYNTLNIDAEGPLALNAGATGGQGLNGGSPGGFGGGGGDWDGNSYGAGGGGYYGGWETAASSSASSSQYTTYLLSGGDIQNDYLGPISYVNPSRISESDLGFHGSTSVSTSDSGQTGGQVVLAFSPV